MTHRLVVLVFMGLTLSGRAQSARPGKSDPDIAAFNKALSRKCPAKHPEWLTLGDLNLAMQPFVNRLTPAEQALEARIEDRFCAGRDAGIRCVNAAYIKTAARLGLTRALAAEVCRGSPSCTALFECG